MKKKKKERKLTHGPATEKVLICGRVITLFPGYMLIKGFPLFSKIRVISYNSLVLSLHGQDVSIDLEHLTAFHDPHPHLHIGSPSALSTMHHGHHWPHAATSIEINLNRKSSLPQLLCHEPHFKCSVVTKG